MGEIEDLLAQMKAEYQKRDQEKPMPSPSSRQEKDRSPAEFKVNYAGDSATDALLKALALENQERQQQEAAEKELVEELLAGKTTAFEEKDFRFICAKSENNPWILVYRNAILKNFALFMKKKSNKMQKY